MATSRGVDRHFRGPGRQKSLRKGKTSGDATRGPQRPSPSEDADPELRHSKYLPRPAILYLSTRCPGTPTWLPHPPAHLFTLPNHPHLLTHLPLTLSSVLQCVWFPSPAWLQTVSSVMMNVCEHSGLISSCRRPWKALLLGCVKIYALELYKQEETRSHTGVLRWDSSSNNCWIKSNHPAKIKTPFTLSCSDDAESVRTLVLRSQSCRRRLPGGLAVAAGCIARIRGHQNVQQAPRWSVA